MRSDIDLNPSRYVLLNGLPADKDPNTKTGEIKPNDPQAYYPYYDASKHPDAFHTPIKNKSHNQNVIYQKDKAPYYGPYPSKTVITKDQPDGIKVKVKIADVSQSFPSVENIVQMTRSFDELNKVVPKPGTYYDPSSADIAKKKADLTNNINNMKNNLKESQIVNANISNPITLVQKTPYNIVQNSRNADIEGTNKFIADNYHSNVPIYQPPNPTPSPNVLPPAPAINKLDVIPSEKLKRHPDTQGMKTEKVRIVSLRRS